MAARKAASTTDEKVGYIIEKEDGTYMKVSVPRSWKVTYGPIWMPTGKGSGHTNEMKYCLRFWEGAKENQRAMFAKVKSFRIDEIEIEEQFSTTEERVVYEDTGQGRKQHTVQVKKTEWRDPLNPPEFKNRQARIVDNSEPEF